MVLERLELRNFQCHEKLTLDLDPRVTTLVGESDRGKSAVLRGLRWLVFNKPTGDAFVRRGLHDGRGRACSVRLKIDGHAVGRHRGGRTGNTYSLDQRVYRAIGSGTPEGVAALLNLGDVHLQGQHDAPFWFGLPAPEVARQLNAVVNLALIDRVLTALAKDARQAQAAVDVTRDRLRGAKTRRKALGWVGQADAALRRVEAQQEQLKLNRNKRARLVNLLEGVSQAGLTLENARATQESGVAAVAAGEQAVAVRGRVESLGRVLRDIRVLRVNLGRAREEARAAERAWAKARKGRCPACGRG